MQNELAQLEAELAIDRPIARQIKGSVGALLNKQEDLPEHKVPQAKAMPKQRAKLIPKPKPKFTPSAKKMTRASDSSHDLTRAQKRLAPWSKPGRCLAESINCPWCQDCSECACNCSCIAQAEGWFEPV